MRELRALLSGNWWGRALFLIGFLALFSCEETTGPGDEADTVQQKLLIYTGNDTIAANGGQTQVLVKVYAEDDTTNTVSGVKVSFSANQAGSKLYIQAQNETTDANGYARATLFAGSRAGTAAVTASIASFSNTAFLTVTYGAGLVNSNKASIPADGLSEASITATVIDSLGQPLPGVQVMFNSSAGTITPQVYSDQEGKAVATLRSEPSATDITATVSAQTALGKVAKIVQDAQDTGSSTDDDVTANQDDAASADTSDDADEGLVAAEKPAATEAALGSTSVIFRGITVTGSSGKNLVFANGADSTQVTINIRETSTSQPLPGARVTFASNLGKVRSSEGTTDNDGNVSFWFFGGSVSGTAIVTATYAAGLAHTEEIMLTKQVYMTIQSAPSTISANGSDTSEIKAMLYDADNNPIANETVYFSSTLGRIQSEAQTNEWGEATVSLRSARFNGTAQVSAKYSTIEKITPVEFTGGGISVNASPLILVADGDTSSRITVTLSDASGTPIVDERVEFSTSLGTLISPDGLTENESIVDSTTTSGTVFVNVKSSEAGDANIRITASGVSDSVTVNFTDYTFSLSTDTDHAIAGGGTILVTATLRDKNGQIEPINSDQISFAATLGTITSLEEQTNGTVTAVLTSGSTAGPSTITASIADPSVTTSTAVMFEAADVGSVNLEASRNFVRVGGNTVTLTAKVFDFSGNPKPGETVTFSIVSGPGGGERLESGSAVTNEIGQATVVFVSGMSGSVQNGIEIKVNIGTITDSVFLTVTGQPESVEVGYSAESFATHPDGTSSVLISAIVSDVNRNKVVDGTVVNFSLSGNVGVIEPEVETKEGVASTRLIYSASDAGKTVLVTAASGGKQNAKQIILPGSQGTVAAIKVTPIETNVVADGISTKLFEISLTGTNGEPLSSQTVYCSTSIGTVQPSAVTGDPTNPNAAPGKTTITYTSPALREDTRATLTFTAGDQSVTTAVNLKGVTLHASIDPTTLPSDGQSKATVNVLVKETTSHVPISGGTVRFGASDGYIGGSSVTDDNGVASTTFTAGFDPGETMIMVSYGATLIDTLSVDVREVMARGIDLFANPPQIAANGISTSTVTALLRDDNFNPVIGETIRFSTTLGTITAADSTDENGRAEAVLVSERRNGRAIITARFKEHVTTIPIDFTGVKMSVAATPENLFAGGEENTVVSAIVKDAADVPIVGEDVSFSWYMDGVFQETLNAETDVQGRASVELSSGTEGIATINITSAGAVDSTNVTFTRMRFEIGSNQTQVSTGGEELNLWARLYDTVNEQYMQNVLVNFHSTLGDITASAYTGLNGMAYAKLQSGSTAGTVTVSATADVGEYRVSGEEQFQFVNANADSIALRIDANIVSVGGNNSALVAVVTDRFGNPVSDALVSFKILEGPAGGEYIHPATVTTGQSGTATTYFYSGQVPSQFERVYIQAQVEDVTSSVAKLTIAGAPEVIRPSYLIDWDLDEINNNDGTYTLPISATVLDINSNGVVDGTTVYFKIEPGEGAVLSPIKTVNSVAVSSVTYPSASAGREVKLTASAGGKEGDITFALPGFSISYMSISAAPKSIPADGKSTSQIRATLFDINGSSANVPDGTLVSFSTEGGTLDPVVARTVDGVATTTLTSDRNSQYSTTVTAQSGIHSAWTEVYFSEVTGNVVQVHDIEVETEETEILADGISSTLVTAHLTQYGGEPVTTPTTVTFDSSIGQITNYVRSDSTGTAQATLTSGEVGTATITATVGDVSGYSTVIVKPGPPRSVQLLFDPAYVNVQGSGKNETLLITADVKDSKNNPVADGNLVRFELVGFYDPAAQLSPQGSNQYTSQPVPTLNGEATVSFHAGTRAGAVRVKATVVDVNGNPVSPSVSSETTQFLVYSGPPYIDLSNPNDPFTESRMTIYCGPLNIYSDQIGTDYNKSTITVMVADKYNNPVPEGTAVYFTASGGTITTATSYTDEEGMASVTIYGSNPFPTLNNSSTVTNPNSTLGGPGSFTVPTYDFDGNGSANNGISIITAYTEGLDHLGRNVTVWNYAPIVFSRSVTTFTVTPSRYTLDVGESATVAIRINDVNGNPVVAGSELSITSTEGTLSKRTVTTTDPGQTTYYVTLTNNLDPFTDQAGNSVVTVELTSPNGDHSAESAPVFMTLQSP